MITNEFLDTIKRIGAIADDYKNKTGQTPNRVVIARDLDKKLTDVVSGNAFLIHGMRVSVNCNFPDGYIMVSREEPGWGITSGFGSSAAGCCKSPLC